MGGRGPRIYTAKSKRGQLLPGVRVISTDMRNGIRAGHDFGGPKSFKSSCCFVMMEERIIRRREEEKGEGGGGGGG